MATSQKAFEAARVKVQSWVAKHPIEHAFSSRSSVAPVLAEWRSEDRDAFVAVGEVTDTIQNLSERLNTYAAQLPRQVRWQAELLVAELADEHDVPGLLGAAGQAVREVLAAEHRAVLEDVNGQRQQTLDYLTAERLAALAALRQERIEALTAVEALQGRAVDAAMVRLRSRRGLRAVAAGRAARRPDVLGRDARGARLSADGRASWLIVGPTVVHAARRSGALVRARGEPAAAETKGRST